MTRWTDRPAYVAALAFVAGAAVAGGLLFFLLARDGDEEGDDRPAAGTTATVPATIPGGAVTAPATSAATPSPRPAGTPRPTGITDPDEALAAFVRDELDSEHIGACPSELAPGEEPPAGICSRELYRGEELVTFFLGAPFSEGIGEAVLTRNEDGAWSVSFVPAPPLGEFDISVGSQAVVFGSGDCLNFREAPSLSAAALWCQLDGTRGTVAEGPVDADGITWWRLQDLGWASAEYLVPVAE